MDTYERAQLQRAIDHRRTDAINSLTGAPPSPAKAQALATLALVDQVKLLTDAVERNTRQGAIDR